MAEPVHPVRKNLRSGLGVIGGGHVAVRLGASIEPAARAVLDGCVLSYVVECRFQLVGVLELVVFLMGSAVPWTITVLPEANYSVATANRTSVLRLPGVSLAVLLADEIALHVIATVVLTVGYLARAFVFSRSSPAT